MTIHWIKSVLIVANHGFEYTSCLNKEKRCESYISYRWWILLCLYITRGLCNLKTFSKCKKKKEKKEIYFNKRLCIYLITNNQSIRTADYLNGSIKISDHIIATFLVLLLELLKFYWLLFYFIISYNISKVLEHTLCK